MMEFVGIRVKYSDYPERLNRLIAVRNDVNLAELGYVIGEMLNVEFEHMYYFMDGNNRYVPESMLGEDFGSIKYLSMKYASLSDINKKFTYLYDTGEGYEFDCEILDKPIDVVVDDDDNLDPLIGRMIEGKGIGIFEDGRSSLNDYFSGVTKPNSKHGPNEWDVLPYHLDLKKFSDYEKPLLYSAFDVYASEMDFYLDYNDEGYNELPFYGDEDEDFYDDFDDEEIDPEVLLGIAKHAAASDIFLLKEVNEKYRQLILKYDINEAYEKIVDCLIKAHEMANEDIIEEEDIEEKYLELVEDLY